MHSCVSLAVPFPHLYFRKPGSHNLKCSPGDPLANSKSTLTTRLNWLLYKRPASIQASRSPSKGEPVSKEELYLRTTARRVGRIPLKERCFGLTEDLTGGALSLCTASVSCPPRGKQVPRGWELPKEGTSATSEKGPKEPAHVQQPSGTGTPYLTHSPGSNATLRHSRQPPQKGPSSAEPRTLARVVSGKSLLPESASVRPSLTALPRHLKFTDP
ncbi:hypothetical protein GW7_06341 [Heterocephalus glaber]|uniref:Uncharacterized protein n=1 Tax=Heterocephalus glaber TaxID=10181 RepID=G5B9T6_HETGA|nr:hypothetical protein GW7_06341 [Heterocephalus glaber]